MNEIRHVIHHMPGLFKIGISLRSLLHNEGDMSENDPDNAENRQLFIETLGIGDRQIIHNRQVHSKRIVEAKPGIVTDADGLISDNADHALYILTADCFNIFFSTGGGKRFGIVHAGWKGVLNGIVSEMRKLMKGETRIVIGQGICPEHFTVQDDVMKFFEDKYGRRHIEQSKNVFSVDLRSIIEETLKNSGQIEHIDMCNVCDNDKLFSYREGDTLKRNMSIIWRANE